MESWQGKRISVLGLARSGLAVAEVLGQRGARVLLSDQRSAEQLGDLIAQAQALGAQVETGGHSQQLLDCDALVISPGVSLYAPTVQQALEMGVPVMGEVEVAYRLCHKPLLAVTGTNGKSTTCSLLAEILGERGRLAGNIGVPLVSEVSSELPGVDYVVAEISSFQLETVHNFRPHLALLTNVTPDHLDRHKGMEEYIRAKARLFAYQQDSDLAVFNADDEAARRVADWVSQGRLPSWPHFPHPRQEARPVLFYSTELEVPHGAWLAEGQFWLRLPGQEAKAELVWDFPNLPGPHNLSNALAAFLAARLLGVPVARIAEAFTGYARMHHRLEVVCQSQGVTFVDDSKATNVSSVESALMTYQDPVVLIAGGRDKGLDLPLLGRVLAQHCHALVTIGEAGPQILAQAQSHGLVRGEQASSLMAAVERAFELCPRPGVVLLSPACTSFDMFLNAEHRGDEFARCARQVSERVSLSENIDAGEVSERVSLSENIDKRRSNHEIAAG